MVFDDDFDSFFIFWSLASFFKSFQDSLPSWSCSSSPKYLRKIWSLTMGVDFRANSWTAKRRLGNRDAK